MVEANPARGVTYVTDILVLQIWKWTKKRMHIMFRAGATNDGIGVDGHIGLAMALGLTPTPSGTFEEPNFFATTNIGLWLDGCQRK